ncbi:hypothetical protein NDU88_000178 [Pleurodeles waltl]|uniref:Uncharacterized protein n=1 Tax=Pleurodeles waltl TaxID=8319 RepID=A0AAV7LDW3_PLEWA|nr:hypothetical protein NDU88_000178 [Pleurodeles waltl]
MGPPGSHVPKITSCHQLAHEQHSHNPVPAHRTQYWKAELRKTRLYKRNVLPEDPGGTEQRLSDLVHIHVTTVLGMVVIYVAHTIYFQPFMRPLSNVF